MNTLTKHTLLIASSILACVLATASLIAQENHKPVAPPAHVLKSDTLAVAKIDLQAIKSQEIMDMLFSDQKTPNNNAVSMTVNAALNTLRDAGASEVYASLQAGIIPYGGIVLVIPCSDTETVANFVSGFTAMIPQPPYSVVQKPGLVVVCPKQLENSLADATANNSADRQDLLEGLQSVSAFPHQLAISFPSELRASVARLLPEQLPEDAPFELSPQQWAKQVNTLTVGWDLPPDLSFQLIIVSPNEEGAKWTVKEVQRLADLVPDLGSSLQATTEGTKAKFHFDNEQLVVMMEKLVQQSRQTARQSQVANNLKQLAMAMHHYHATYNQIVPNAIVDESGKPLLSWRVTLLPYLGQAELFQQFKLDEPWDSEHNKALISKMPASYADPTSDIAAGMTRTRLPYFDGSVGATDKPLRIRDITDGTSNTIWLVHAPVSAAVEWTKPDRWEMDANNLKRSLFGDAAATYAAYLDGSVRSIDAGKSLEWLKYSLQYADGNLIPNE